jgi:chromatin segregation and condensation protein Rec8/ScpA/Scc1 (kleisin family)
VQRIGLFLAVLELVRTRCVDVVQDDLDGAIQVVLRDDAPDDLDIAAVPALDTEDAETPPEA